MKKKTIATALGVISAVFWFLPWVYVEFMGMNGYQSGIHIGGLSYLILVSSLAYAVLSWMELHVPRLISSGLCMGVTGLYLVIAGVSVAWGLIGLFLLSTVAVALAFKDYKRVIPLEEKSKI